MSQFTALSRSDAAPNMSPFFDRTSAKPMSTSFTPGGDSKKAAAKFSGEAQISQGNSFQCCEYVQ